MKLLCYKKEYLPQFRDADDVSSDEDSDSDGDYDSHLVNHQMSTIHEVPGGVQSIELNNVDASECWHKWVTLLAPSRLPQRVVGITELNTLRLKQNGCHFADAIFKHIFVNENICILIQISLNNCSQESTGQ